MIGMSVMKKVNEFFKEQTVLCIAFVCAAVSAVIVPPDREYIGYLNFSTLILLFSLMAAVAGFGKCGIFNRLSAAIISKCGSVRKLVFVMMNVCFFSSMLITNDVALITFVPVTIMIFQQSGVINSRSLIMTVVIETAAANLGSMLLPTGNPQNIYLCSNYEMSPAKVIATLLPYGIVSYLILSLSVLLIAEARLEQVNGNKMTSKEALPYRIAVPCIIIFAVSLLTVAGVVNEYICIVISMILIIAADKSLFTKIDYALLLTFVCFFILSGNVGRIETIRGLLSDAINGREVAVSVIASQVISNVPAAVLLSAFTDKAELLLIGTNIGGLGTPIASLASLISYKLYASSKEAKGGRYMTVFMVYNVIFLALLCAFSAIIK